MKEYTNTRTTLTVPLAAWLVLGCASSTETPVDSNTGGATQNAANSHSGGLPSDGGTATSGGTATGGTDTGTAAGGTSSGGRATGGTPDSGGNVTGGRATGGSGTSVGGTSSGGRASGGSSSAGGTTGGVRTGGTSSTGGSAIGGSATGGTAGTEAQTGGASSGSDVPSGEGFYKELFMDVGVGLDDVDRLPAADQLGYRWEFVSGEDVAVQHSYMTSNANDANGVLLYPDREPRFMMLYTGGGYGDHAGPVGAEGIQNVQDFFHNGGSYTGTCNGNYLAWSWGYNFWPGQMKIDSHEGEVEGTIPEDSPILQYYDFGGDHLIQGLMHFKGGYATGTLPEGTEVLLIGKSASTPIDGDGHPTGWAYKPSATSGRMCGLSDHPEYAFRPGEVMDYLAAAFHYARDGVAPPDVKASLVNGEERVMNKASEDGDPAYTKIGDRQYHHFTVSLPNGADEMTVTLKADDRYDMNLYVAANTFALASQAQYEDTSQGANKALTVASPEPGTWYIGVECATTVVATKNTDGYDYSGDLEVLDGVEYSIEAVWTE
ncbi:MAG: hypothetical protein JW940_20700 [Polyangiaceae bacterium]|nr:hypothetical protein [Polyangiaceae bacterium]